MKIEDCYKIDRIIYIFIYVYFISLVSKTIQQEDYEITNKFKMHKFKVHVEKIISIKKPEAGT